MATYSGSTAAILSNYSEALKVFYLPAVQEQLNNDNVLSAMIDTNEEDVSGKSATIECHYGRNSGTGVAKDGGAMPTAGYQKFQTAKVPMRYNYGRVTFSGPTIAATRDEKGSYARVIDTEIRGVVDDVKKETNRMMWGAGYGVLARWETGTSTTVTVPKQYRGNAISNDGFGSTFGWKYLEENNQCVLADVTVGSAGASALIAVGTSAISVSAIDSTGSTSVDSATVTDVGTPIAGDFYIRPGAGVTTTTGSAAGAFRLEMMGLRGIVTNTDLDVISVHSYASGASYEGLATDDPLQGLDIDTHAWWKSTVDTHSSGRYQGQRALTLQKMQQVFDKVEMKAGKDYGPDLILTTHALRREYLDIMQADRRHVNTMTLDGGFTALDYNGVPLVVDNDAIDGEMYFITTKDLKIYRMSDYEWMSKDGAVLDRVAGYDAYEAILFRYAELGTTRRNAHGVLCDLAYEQDR